MGTLTEIFGTKKVLLDKEVAEAVAPKISKLTNTAIIVKKAQEV